MGPRKHFLDWLRVFAFGLLILFHVGCLYASWTYNLKSPQTFPGIDGVLMAINPWRMALLFLISGVACRYLLVKLGTGGMALDRVRRLVPPLLVGMFVVIPPQTYVELVSKGVTHESYLHFWIFDYLRADQTLVAPLHKTVPTYDHLWFLVYLFNYAIALALITGLWRVIARRIGYGGASPVIPLSVLVVAPCLWLIATIFVIERYAPVTFWVGNDWGSHLKWGGMFLTGVLLAGRPDYWEWTQRHRVSLALVALVSLSLQTLNWAYWLTGLANPFWSMMGWSAASGLFAWTMIGALIGYAGRYLNRASPLLAHLNEAVLPVYVLHQPILLIAAYLIFPLRLRWWEEASVLSAITLVGCVAIYEVAIRPFGPMRVLFGLKLKPGASGRAVGLYSPSESPTSTARGAS